MKKFLHTSIRILGVLCLLALPMSMQQVEAKKPQITGKININTASPEQLRLLPRVGPKIAMRIVAYRQKSKFKVPHEITKVKGIGRKTFEKMKPYITVGNSTHVTVKAPAKSK
jgi:competence protein ComEA